MINEFTHFLNFKISIAQCTCKFSHSIFSRAKVQRSFFSLYSDIPIRIYYYATVMKLGEREYISAPNQMKRVKHIKTDAHRNT